MTILAIALFSALAFFGIAGARGEAGALALVFPPWWTGRDSFLAAAETGPVVAMGGLPFIVIVPAADGPRRARGEWLRFRVTSSSCRPTGDRP